jgi:hypothetical protein
MKTPFEILQELEKIPATITGQVNTQGINAIKQGYLQIFDLFSPSNTFQWHLFVTIVIPRIIKNEERIAKQLNALYLRQKQAQLQESVSTNEKDLSSKEPNQPLSPKEIHSFIVSSLYTSNKS